ncbi:SusC/RagA family TonB-linked outer membrane protein [Sphingobacterium sp. CZ-UAM]|uniref:SusC/RagA family TonB-linked outer membrane protein n=1 Tax=Sphingobacterium sp. CZ-UAM TaxID=1933868 RepID=UPI001C3772EC|nr:TonB-dependent receptor [Sphingobacterium sp. CZ-UAM]
MKKRNQRSYASWPYVRLYLCLCLMLLSVTTFAQTREVYGTVQDSAGNILPGVTVSTKNESSKTTTTDVNGKYIITMSDSKSILVFSMVGYSKQEIDTKGSTMLNVVMKQSPDAKLDEVVVTGFGSTRKRTDMIGAITTVRPSELKVPSSNLTQALQGRIAGVIGFQRSGEPGLDDADFYIRGIATFGTQNKPLILIDNIESSVDDLAILQTDDLESFSVMKDATATAIYGSRGANGVILVATKKGYEGPATVSLRLENTISQPTKQIRLADPITYMKLHNEAILTRSPLQELVYSYDKIDNTGKPGANPFVYPMTNWREELLKRSTMNQRVNANLSGGGQLARYYVSGAFTQDNGLLKTDERNTFSSNARNRMVSLLSNITLNFKRSTLLIRLNGQFEQYSGPIPGGAGMYRNIMRSNQTLFPAFFEPDEKTAHLNHILFGNTRLSIKDELPSSYNPYADLMRGYQQKNRSNMGAMLEFNHDFSNIIDGLKFRVMGNTSRQSSFSIDRAYNPFYYDLGSYNAQTGKYSINAINPKTGTEFLNFNESVPEVFSIMYLESTLTYAKTIAEKHNLSGLLVYNMRDKLQTGIRLNGGPATIQTSLPFRNMGISGKMSYTYDSRYFAEFNFGYNGSERFAKAKRYGFFPSVGAAWTISNEKFFAPLKKSITNFRLRGTYGIIGYDAIGDAFDRFFYLSEIDMRSNSKSYRFGSNLDEPSILGIDVLRYANENITWEKSYQKNIALELGLFNNYIFNVDLYHNRRTNMLQTRTDIPSTMGLAATPRDNIGEGVSKGIDINATMNNKFIGENFTLSAFGNFTLAKSKYTKFEEPDYDESYRSKIGHSFKQEFGYIAERLFVDEADVASSPRQTFGAYGAGDIKFRDVNGDGIITGRDQVPLGFPTTPEILYGAGFTLGYKGAHLSLFFQGSARQSFWINAGAGLVPDNFGTAPFIGDKQLLQAYVDDHWSESNRNIYALWPRLTADASFGLGNNSVNNTWFMRDGSFIRLKQAEIDYNFTQNGSKGLLKRAHIKQLRIYANGSNLLVWSPFKLWDPEMAGSGLNYPLQRVFNMGILASF